MASQMLVQACKKKDYIWIDIVKEDLRSFDIYGVVYRATYSNTVVCSDRSNNKLKVIKMYPKSFVLKNLNVKNSILNEIKNSINFQFQNFFIQPNFLKESSSFVYIVFPYQTGGTLKNIVKFGNAGILSTEEKEFVCAETTVAIFALHSRVIAHLDVKPENF